MATNQSLYEEMCEVYSDYKAGRLVPYSKKHVYVAVLTLSADYDFDDVLTDFQQEVDCCWTGIEIQSFKEAT